MSKKKPTTTTTTTAPKNSSANATATASPAPSPDSQPTSPPSRAPSPKRRTTKSSSGASRSRQSEGSRGGAAYAREKGIVEVKVPLTQEQKDALREAVGEHMSRTKERMSDREWCRRAVLVSLGIEIDGDG